MKFEAITTLAKRPKGDLVIVPFYQGKERGEAAVSVPHLKEAYDPILKAGDFKGKAGSTMLAYLTGKKEKRLLLLGLGEEKECTIEALRRAYAAAMKRAKGKAWPHLNVILPKSSKLSVDEITRGVAEGIALTSYVFEEHKSKHNQELYHVKNVAFVGAKDPKILEKVLSINEGVTLARNLINRNALDVTPQALGMEAMKIAKTHPSVKVKVLGKKELEKEKMGLLLAVGCGSRVDPALIVMEYWGDPKSDELTMIVGKGITYDTGGLNLKPTGSIEDMRSDMAAGAATIGLIQAAAAIKLKANIVALVAATENPIGRAAYKPGDVYRSHAGITVEITNTDAEGRLVLADALSYGQKHFSPTRIIDFATLTGAIVIALGEERAGLYSNNEKLVKAFEKAGDLSGEKVWRMPLDPEYKELMKSDIADIRNAGKKRMAGSITAAIFLQEFVKKGMPWVHLDIAGMGFIDAPMRYHQTQATGVGLRLLIDFLENV